MNWAKKLLSPHALCTRFFKISIPLLFSSPPLYQSATSSERKGFKKGKKSKQKYTTTTCSRRTLSTSSFAHSPSSSNFDFKRRHTYFTMNFSGPEKNAYRIKFSYPQQVSPEKRKSPHRSSLVNLFVPDQNPPQSVDIRYRTPSPKRKKSCDTVVLTVIDIDLKYLNIPLATESSMSYSDFLKSIGRDPGFFNLLIRHRFK